MGATHGFLNLLWSSFPILGHNVHDSHCGWCNNRGQQLFWSSSSSSRYRTPGMISRGVQGTHISRGPDAGSAIPDRLPGPRSASGLASRVPGDRRAAWSPTPAPRRACSASDPLFAPHGTVENRLGQVHLRPSHFLLQPGHMYLKPCVDWLRSPRDSSQP